MNFLAKFSKFPKFPKFPKFLSFQKKKLQIFPLFWLVVHYLQGSSIKSDCNFVETWETIV